MKLWKVFVKSNPKIYVHANSQHFLRDKNQLNIPFLLLRQNLSTETKRILVPATHNLLNLHRKIFRQDIRCSPYQTPVEAENTVGCQTQKMVK